MHVYVNQLNIMNSGPWSTLRPSKVRGSVFEAHFSSTGFSLLFKAKWAWALCFFFSEMLQWTLNTKDFVYKLDLFSWFTWFFRPFHVTYITCLIVKKTLFTWFLVHWWYPLVSEDWPLGMKEAIKLLWFYGGGGKANWLLLRSHVFCFLFLFVCLFLCVFSVILILTYHLSKSGFLQMTLNFALV